jgi:hypothetical protein
MGTVSELIREHLMHQLQNSIRQPSWYFCYCLAAGSSSCIPLCNTTYLDTFGIIVAAWMLLLACVFGWLAYQRALRCTCVLRVEHILARSTGHPHAYSALPDGSSDDDADGGASAVGGSSTGTTVVRMDVDEVVPGSQWGLASSGRAGSLSAGSETGTRRGLPPGYGGLTDGAHAAAASTPAGRRGSQEEGRIESEGPARPDNGGQSREIQRGQGDADNTGNGRVPHSAHPQQSDTSALAPSGSSNGRGTPGKVETAVRAAANAAAARKTPQTPRPTGSSTEGGSGGGGTEGGVTRALSLRSGSLQRQQQQEHAPSATEAAGGDDGLHFAPLEEPYNPMGAGDGDPFGAGGITSSRDGHSSRPPLSLPGSPPVTPSALSDSLPPLPPPPPPEPPMPAPLPPSLAPLLPNAQDAAAAGAQSGAAPDPSSTLYSNGAPWHAPDSSFSGGHRRQGTGSYNGSTRVGPGHHPKPSFGTLHPELRWQLTAVQGPPAVLSWENVTCRVRLPQGRERYVLQAISGIAGPAPQHYNQQKPGGGGAQGHLRPGSASRQQGSYQTLSDVAADGAGVIAHIGGNGVGMGPSGSQGGAAAATSSGRRPGSCLFAILGPSGAGERCVRSNSGVACVVTAG